jgi:ribonuclease G
MKREVLLDSLCGQKRLAVLEDGVLSELYIEREGSESISGNIYAGHVENVLPGMNAAFVNIGLEKNAFLYAGDIQMDTRGETELADQLSTMNIRDLVRHGQQILVQVVKESGGTKGPRVSSHITLAGRLIVLIPTMRYVGVSRKITDSDERSRLRTIAEKLCEDYGYGMIVRTAAEGLAEEAIRAEYEALLGAKNIIKEQKPVLAISVYHKFDDIYKLALLIDSFGVRYKYYLRHYTMGVAETVLYAVYS